MSVNTLLRKSTKAAALPLARRLNKQPGDAVVLLYHKVGAGGREIDIPTPAFKEQLRLMARSERVATLDDCVQSGGVTVSVDDGFVDFYDNVLPAAVEFGVPVLLYLATEAVAGNGHSSSDSLTWGQLAEAVSTGFVEIGAHTHSHANLGRATASEAEQEMRRSKETIEDRLGVECRHFSYPWSLASPEAESVARRLFATAALPWGTNRAGAIDPYRIARTPVLKSDGSFFFRAKLAGRLDGEAVVYKALRRGPWKAS